MSEDKSESTPKAAPDKKIKLGKSMGFVITEPFCPICDELGHKEELHEVVGLEEVSVNPQAAKGAARVVDCTGGCRYGLEPYYNPRSDSSFCYMLLRSERNPGAIVNHYWFKPEFIKPPL